MVFNITDQGHQFDILYLDFAKAFDCVPHALLVKKLEMFGIFGHLQAWIKNYLFNRKQKVLVEGVSSKYVNM